MSSSSPKSPDLATMSFDEYMEFLLVPYEEVALAFNNFADDNLIARGTCARVYKGQLMQSGQLINVVARNLVNQDLVVKELRASYYFDHKNIVSVFKITPGVESECEIVIIINKHEANGSLNNHLSSSTLTWMQRLKICVGVADALSYLHYGYDEYYSIIHGHVKSSSILLDDNWEPKLSGFGFFCVLNDRHHLYPTTKFNGKSQYLDPAYEQTKGLTLKSDVFSFGVVLFEVLFGREASIPDDDDKWYFQLARLHYEEKTLDDMIDQDLRKQMDFKSLKIFAEIAYFCLKEQRKQRPDMDHVVKELQRALEIQQKHENQEHSAAALEVTLSNILKMKNLDHLRIRLSDIELATNQFSEKYCIGSGGYGMVYEAKLDHFDGKTVAIKRISSRVDGQAEQVFLAEIEMLSSCKHQNIVSLLGFCAEGPERILVYEFVSNGSLDDYLGNTDRITSFTWRQRLQICLDIAHGLNYLHTSTKDKPMIIHRDIKSANILLDDKWVAKIGDFGLSKLNHADQGSTLMTKHIAGTEVYLDPEYSNTGKLKKTSDIYSFGVVLFEIMCGRLAYDNIYDINDEKGLPSVARRCFNGGTLRKIVDPKLREADENIFMLNEGLNQHSFDAFSNIAYQCLSKTQAERPTMRVVIEELEKAFNFDKNSKDNLQISLKDIQLATQNFSDDNCIGEGRYWKQYRGEISHSNANGCNTVVVKRWDSKSSKGHQQFLTELKILFEYKHENIIALMGYCNEMDERIIVYEHASNGSLDEYVNDFSTLTWMQRLKICLDIARVLCFLHFGGRNKLDRHNYTVVHRDIKTSSFLLDADWQVKVSNFELCSLSEDDQDIEHATDNVHGSQGYVSVDYKHGYLTASSDVYSLGVVLCEMICGRLAWEEGCMDHSESLGPLFKRHFEENLMSKLIPSGIQKQLAVKSSLTFLEVALQCLDDEADSRPLASSVVTELEKALESQEDHEIWEPKLPRDYKEIIQMSRTPEIYSAVTKKKLYDMFTKGILLGDKLVVSINKNGEINEMISAKSSYKNPRSHKWQCVPLSRFPIVAKMLNISNLKIKASIKAQYISTDVVYGVHLVFKFCESRKFSEDPIYVNLKYRLRDETLHSFFATWRDDEWMMIELCRFFNGQEDAVYKFLLESFSQCYCGNGAIYVEGIEFRAIEKVKHEGSNKLKDVQLVLKSNANMDEIQDLPSDSEEDFRICKTNDNCEKVFLLSQVNGKKHPMLSAKDALHNSQYVKFFSLISSTQSRFQEVIELQSQQVFRIKCKIESQMLSPDTDYVCYLVFKLSDKCRALHCPVKVRDLLHWKNKMPKIIYFRSPSPWNQREGNSVPELRKDGWMEVAVWKFNSNHENRKNCVPVNLKLITYEGTMLGLIICGLEFRHL